MITDPYLLVLNIPLHWHDGGYWADPLWKKDLEAHCVQIDTLAIACPVVRRPPPRDWQRVTATGIAVHPLPEMGRLSPLLLPVFAWRLRRAISAATIVHVGVAGWPFPLGWLAIPIARLQRRRLVVVVESAFWRIPSGVVASARARWRAMLWERINRRAVAACDISFFTTSSYREDLHTCGRGAAYVLPAVWIDDEQLIAPDRLVELAQGRRGRLLFAGRLTHGKGVDLLLQAAVRSGVPVDIAGDGDLREAVAIAGRRHPELVRLIEPVNYGSAFAALLDEYCALVVPTISDEQPRVIFDAFARGLAVLASATTGNRQIVGDGHHGLLFAPGDIDALARTLSVAQGDPDRIAAMGVAARAAVTGRTHAAMHAERALRITEALLTDPQAGRWREANDRPAARVETRA